MLEAAADVHVYRPSHTATLEVTGNSTPQECAFTSVGDQTRGMHYRLTELPLLLLTTFDEARAWVRTLEHFETVQRGMNGARVVTLNQLERIAVARLIAANRGVPRPRALELASNLQRGVVAVQWLEAHREVLGISTLEARVAALESR
jgi:hypothetical protein